MIESLEQLRGRVAVLAQVKPAVKALIEGLVEKVEDFKGDVGALRAALQRLLADPDLRRRFGEAGRARIAEHFTWQRFGDETLRAYEDALKEPPTR